MDNGRIISRVCTDSTHGGHSRAFKDRGHSRELYTWRTQQRTIKNGGNNRDLHI